MKKLEGVLRVGLAGGLTVFAVAKFASPYEATYALPVWAYYGSAVFEVVMAALLISSIAIRPASVATMSFFAIGMLLALVYDGDCG